MCKYTLNKVSFESHLGIMKISPSKIYMFFDPWTIK